MLLQFRFADKWDKLCIGAGTLFAIGAGILYPCMYILMGNIGGALVNFELANKNKDLNLSTLNFVLNNKW